jgi:hypothetical protein
MTTEITEKVAQQARKWQQLSELLQDPEISAFLAKEFSRNGTAVASAIHARSDSAEHPESRKGDLIKTVNDVCKEFHPNTTFTAYDVLKQMRAHGFVFAAAKPEIAVNGALRKIVGRHNVIRLVRRGSGRRPNHYRRLETEEVDQPKS